MGEKKWDEKEKVEEGEEGERKRGKREGRIQANTIS